MSDSPAAAPAVADLRMGWVLVGTLLLSVATLHLELLQTRLFSVMLWNHLVYMVVTLAIMGFAISGTLLHVVRPLREAGPLRVAAGSAAGFALSLIVCFAISGRLTLVQEAMGGLQEQPGGWRYAALSLRYSYHVIPFIFAGLGILAVLNLGARTVHRAYFANLVGSAIGCLAFVATLSPLGGPRALGVIALTGCAAAIAFTLAAPRRRWGGPAVGLLAAVGAVAGAERLFPVPIAWNKLYYVVNPPAMGRPIEHTVWTPLCRLDALNVGDMTLIFQDGDASMHVFPWAGHDAPNPLEQWTQRGGSGVYELGYVGRDVEHVLVIGVGGGHDLLEALRRDVTHVTGAELNPEIVSLMRGKYASYIGHLFSHPKVTVYASEGRSFIRRSADKYDLVQLTGTDTYTALSTGAYILSENYLYTVEGLRDYLTHLRPNGRVVVTRARFDPPRENLRLVAIGIEALRQLGAQRPAHHVIVIADNDPRAFNFTSVIFKREPFTPREVRDYEEWLATRPKLELLYAPGRAFPPGNAFAAYLRRVTAGEETQFVSAYPYLITPVTPVTDDSPFFFRYYKWGALFQPLSNNPLTYFSQLGSEPIGLYVLGALLAMSVAITVGLAVLPLATQAGRVAPPPRRWALLGFVGALGLGYIAVEISMVQRFVLLLGHPTFSLSVGIATFLTASGFGSMVAGRLTWAPRRIVFMGVVGLVVGNAAVALLFPVLSQATLAAPLPLRVAVTVAVLAPGAFFMGMPFPTGLAWMHQRCPHLVPWAWAVNGGTSVVASILAIVIAMATRFTVVLVGALGIYVLGMFLFEYATALGASAPAGGRRAGAKLLEAVSSPPAT